MNRFSAFSGLIGLLFFISCEPSTLTHERFIFNNTSEDTIIVINPDFDDAIDTITPGNRALIREFEALNTDRGFEPCAWNGDTLIVFNLDDENLLRSVKVEEHWTFTITGETDQLQQCTFTVIDDDF